MSRRTGERLPVRLTRRGRVVLGAVATGAILGPGIGAGAVVVSQDSDPVLPADCTAAVGPREDFWTLGAAIGELVGQDSRQVTYEIREANPGVGAGELQPGTLVAIPGEYCGVVAEYRIGQFPGTAG